MVAECAGNLAYLDLIDLLLLPLSLLIVEVSYCRRYLLLLAEPSNDIEEEPPTPLRMVTMVIIYLIHVPEIWFGVRQALYSGFELPRLIFCAKFNVLQYTIEVNMLRI